MLCINMKSSLSHSICSVSLMPFSGSSCLQDTLDCVIRHSCTLFSRCLPGSMLLVRDVIDAAENVLNIKGYQRAMDRVSPLCTPSLLMFVLSPVAWFFICYMLFRKGAIFFFFLSSVCCENADVGWFAATVYDCLAIGLCWVICSHCVLLPAAGYRLVLQLPAWCMTLLLCFLSFSLSIWTPDSFALTFFLRSQSLQLIEERFCNITCTNLLQTFRRIAVDFFFLCADLVGMCSRCIYSGRVVRF